jgi:Tol biopolymer transport system component
MKRHSTLWVALALILVVALSAYAQQSAGQLLQSGLYQEDVRGDLEEAIKIYERILEDFPTDRPVAAKALLHIGLCYEKVGATEAQKAYRRLLDEYADQSESVRIAREHLQRLDAGSTGIEVSGATYRLVFDDQMVGMVVNSSDFSPSGDRIVFASQSKIYIADRTGTVIRPILEDAGPWKYISALQWSPDGRLIAYRAIKDPASYPDTRATYAFFVISANGGTPRQVGPELTTGWMRNRLYWTPDGQHLTYQNFDGIRTITLDGEEVRLISRRDLPGIYWRMVVSLSPDGRWLTLDAPKEKATNRSDADLCILPVEGGPVRRLTNLPGFNGQAAWAPDGNTIYFVSGSEDVCNIWQLPIDPETGMEKGEPQQVTFFNDAKVMFPKVIGKGDQIAFGMERSSTSIQVADASSPHDSRTLVAGRWPQLSPDGQTLYYVDDGIFAMPREGGTPRRLTPSGPQEGHEWLAAFAISPDGQTLAYTNEFSDGFAIFTVPTGGGEPELLVEVDPEGCGCEVPEWSPDGTELAYATEKGLYVIPAIGGEPRKLAHMDLTWEEWNVRWSPDGKFIAAFGYNPKDENDVYVVPAAGGELRKLSPDDEDGEYKEGLEWHPDSKRLTYHMSLYKSQTRQVYLDGRPSSLLVDAPDMWDYVGLWAPDGRRFFFAGSAPTENGYAWGIYAYDEVSGEITLASDHVAQLSLPHWSSDGKTMVWSQTRSTGRQTWVMENFLPESTASK